MKQITDKKIIEIMKIPTRTLKNFKTTNQDNWRYIIYTYLKSKSEEELKEFINNQKNI